MIGYLYDNDERSKEWGETIETMSKWFAEAKEYKDKYEELTNEYNELVEKYSRLWGDYAKLWEQKNIIYPVQPIIWPNVQPSVMPQYPWMEISYTNNLK